MATKKQTGTKGRRTSKKGPVKKAVETVGGVVETVADAVMAIPKKLTSRKSKSSSKKTTTKKAATKKRGTRKKTTQEG